MRQVIDLEKELRDAGILGQPTANRQTIAKTLQLVARAHGVKVSVLRSQRRDKYASRARCDAYAALRYLDMTTTEIGQALGRDHSTVAVMLKKRQLERQVGMRLTWKESLL